MFHVITTEDGHDGFLLEQDTVGQHIDTFLRNKTEPSWLNLNWTEPNWNGMTALGLTHTTIATASFIFIFRYFYCMLCRSLRLLGLGVLCFIMRSSALFIKLIMIDRKTFLFLIKRNMIIIWSILQVEKSKEWSGEDGLIENIRVKSQHNDDCISMRRSHVLT